MNDDHHHVKHPFEASSPSRHEMDGAPPAEIEIVWAIVDTRTCLRDALANAVRQHEHRSLDPVVASCRDANELVATLGPCAIGTLVVLLGRPPPNSSLAQEIERVRARFGAAMVALLVDGFDQGAIDLWNECRPIAVIPSSYTAGQVAACLNVVSLHGSIVPVDCVNELLKQALPKPVAPPNADPACLAHVASMLTPRQREVMRYVAMGRSNKYIASELDVCESTIKVHVSELLRRLGATSRTHAAWLFSQLPSDVVMDDRHDIGAKR